MDHLIRLYVVWAVLCALCTATATIAQTDTTFTYQGELKDGGSVANGSFVMDFSLWDALAGGTQIGSTLTFGGVAVSDGRFTVELDYGAAAFNNTNRWLQIDVNATPLSPRQPVSRTPYSIQTRGIFVDASKNVGIGTTSPAWPLDVSGTQAVGRFVSTTSVNGSVIELRNNAATPTNIGAINFVNALGQFRGQVAYTGADDLTFRAGGVERMRLSGNGYLGVGTASPAWPLMVVTSTENIAIYGFNAGSGLKIGVYGLANGLSGRGVYGNASASTGITQGVFGESASSEGNGVVGQATNLSGITTGVFGSSQSSSGRGVYGIADSGIGSTFGVLGEAVSTSGTGVDGQAISNSGSSIGVRGTSQSTSGFGVVGGALASSGLNYGVYGQSNSTAGYDFYANGAGINYGAPSSIRWKRNIEPVVDPLGMLARIRGVYYDWDEAHGGHRDIGMIGEEVGAVLPEIVAYEPDGEFVTGMDYSRLTPLLVEGVNTLQSDNEALRAEVAALRARLDSLEALVEQFTSSNQKVNSQ